MALSSAVTSFRRLGKVKVADLRHADVEKLHRKIAATAPLSGEPGRLGPVENVILGGQVGDAGG